MKRIVCLIIAALFGISLPMVAFSFGAEKHNEYMSYVLFGDEDWKDPKSKIELLEKASYLALDQFNDKAFRNKGERFLQELKDKKVRDLPADISEIDFNSNYDHRRYTHMGWNHNYENDDANWEVRKTILCSTTNKVFNFGLSELGNRFGEKCDSFSALVYYIHVLGDHLDSASKKVEVDKETMIPFATKKATEESPDLFYELKNTCFERLFLDQMDSDLYQEFIRKFEKLEKAARRLQRHGVQTEEQQEKWANNMDDLLVLLEKYIPKLLKEETFFQKEFYK